MTHAAIARAYIATIHNCTAGEALYRLTAGEIADMYEREAAAMAHLWPEQAARLQALADEQALVACGEDEDTLAANKIAGWLDEKRSGPPHGRYA